MSVPLRAVIHEGEGKFAENCGRVKNPVYSQFQPNEKMEISRCNKRRVPDLLQ